MSGKVRNPARRCRICGARCEKQMRYCKLCARERKAAGLPPERVRIAADGTRIISRGNCGGYVANHNTFTAPSGGAPGARKSRRQKGKPTPANS